jgi:Mn2+/Fe2+ NRAMP family transporter
MPEALLFLQALSIVYREGPAFVGKQLTGSSPIKNPMAEKDKILQAPKGKGRFKWLGPAFIWMLSAAGSGELLFTPRIASQYGYTLIWALLLAVAMKWIINREIGRYTVCTGATFFRGLASISQNSRWLLWLILVPQLAVAVATVAGLAGAASTAFVVAVPVPLMIPTIALIVMTASVILLGQYKGVEKATTVLAIIISLSVLAAAFATGPNVKALGRGFIPTVPENVKLDEVLSWLGFMLAGAAGLMWFSYWTAARGYGAASLDTTEPINLQEASIEKKKELKGWVRHMTIANTLAVVGALVIAIAFLILGTELLKPQGLIPKENQVARVLGQLMGGVWGPFGFWFMILAVFITFNSTILSDQDGFGRMFGDGTAILASRWNVPEKWKNPEFLQKAFIVVLLVVLPIITYAIVGEPVGLLKAAGVIEACHIPVVASLILYLNRKTLPEGLKPGGVSTIATGIAGLTFVAFAALYILQMAGIIRL